MSTLPGLPLDKAWPLLSAKHQAKVTQQLKNYLEELRGLQQPDPGWIGSCSHGGAHDDNLRETVQPCGPWKSEKDFNDYLLHHVVKYAPQHALRYAEPIQFYHHNIVFTHGDLNWDHILVDRDTGDVTGIVDWEMACWFPEYWEYNKAHLGWRYRNWLIALLNKVLKPFIDETLPDFELRNYH